MHTCLSRNLETAERAPVLGVKMNPTSETLWQIFKHFHVCVVGFHLWLVYLVCRTEYIIHISHTYIIICLYRFRLSHLIYPPKKSAKKKTMTWHPNSISKQKKNFRILISGPQKLPIPIPLPSHPRSTLRLTSIHQTFRVECMQRGHVRRAVGLLEGEARGKGPTSSCRSLPTSLPGWMMWHDIFPGKGGAGRFNKWPYK